MEHFAGIDGADRSSKEHLRRCAISEKGGSLETLAYFFVPELTGHSAHARWLNLLVCRCIEPS